MVNTSDIRRAHTSILSNIKHGNGVLLQGPSGTGKTESLKELGRCMAKYCVIFNCSSEVNIRTLQKLLSGLCYTGSWLCLDEINRLTAEIMSVVATQINSVRNAVVQSKEVFSFMGKDMRLKRGVGIFSTMNPIYLKRAKLTESLKSYFRVISVNVPDYEKIL
jgi:dynein heavy chain